MAMIQKLGVAFLAMLVLAACEKGPDRSAQATELKADVESQLQVIEHDWSGDRISHSSLTVAPEEGTERFLVTIEGVKVQTEPGGELTIGQVGYAVTPKDEKTFAISDLKLPAEMPFTGAAGASGKLALAVKSFDALWSREFKAFLKVNSELSDIAATDSRGADIRVQSAKMTGDSVDKGNGVFDMTGGLVMTGASATETDGGKLTLGELKVDGKYDSVKLREYMSAVAKIQSLTSKQLAAAETGATPPPLSAEDQKLLGEQMMIIAGSVTGASWQVALSDLGFVESGGQTPFRLAKFGLGATMSGLDGDKSTLALAISHEGLAIDSPETNTPLARAVLPKQGNLSVKVTDVPTQALTKALAEGLPGAIGGGAPIETGLMALGFSLQSVLGNSGVKIVIEPSGWSGEVTKIDADGAFNADAASLFGAVGTLNLALQGLDELLALAQASPDLPESQQVLGMGGMLSAMAQREAGADGKPVDRFKIDITQQGEMLINGKPMGM